ncbi:MAG: hypothetical protein KW788_01335 [Candidatus Doudnabacteria bacterium]|nr:hypothetical protein [Candidatus Doudnabacteria bacterium]
MNRRSLCLVVLALLLATSSAYAQTATKKRPAATAVVKVSDFDPSIQYRRCDPAVKGGESRLVWPFPGQSPLILPDLLRRAGLNGREDIAFDRAVLGPREGESMPEDQRIALGLVQRLIRAGVLKGLDDENNERRTWERFQTLVRENEHHAHDLNLRCGDRVGYMGYAAGSDGNLAIFFRRDYVMGFAPSVWAWSIGPIETPGGWKRVDIILDCFNPRIVQAEKPVVVPPAPAAAASAGTQNTVATKTPVLLVPVIQKHWFDRKGKEVDPPKHYNLRFMAREKASNQVITTLDYASEGSGFAPSGIFSPEAKALFKTGNSYVIVEDPGTIPKGWHSRGPVEFTLTEGNGNAPALMPGNEKDNQNWFARSCVGPIPRWACIAGAAIGSGFLYERLRGHDESSPGRQNTTPPKTPPVVTTSRPLTAGFEIRF